MKKIIKLFTNQKIRSLDEKTRTVEYVISSDAKDRCGEVVEQSWDLENYKKNPIVLWGHDPSQPDNVLGSCLSISSDKDGDETLTTAKVQFAEEGTSKGVDTVWKLVKQGILKTVSVGFIPHTFKKAEDGETDVLADNELLEFSIVPIPANPHAVALAYEDGSISEEDSRFMVKKYETEAEYLKSSLYDTIMKTSKTSKEKTMSEEDLTKIADAIGAALEPVVAKLDDISAKLDDEKPSEDEKPSDEKPADEPEQLADDGAEEDEDEDEDKDDDKETKSMIDAIEKMSDEEVTDLAKELGL